MKPSVSTYPQPDWNGPDSVAKALDALRDANDEISAHDAYDQYLWAVGDNQIGTFFPIVLATLPDLEQLIIHGGFWVQRAVIESLIDLTGSFVPQEGYELYEGIAVQQSLQTAVFAMRSHLLPLATGSDVRAVGATDLIEIIDDLTIKPLH